MKLAQCTSAVASPNCCNLQIEGFSRWHFSDIRSAQLTEKSWNPTAQADCIGLNLLGEQGPQPTPPIHRKILHWTSLIYVQKNADPVKFHRMENLSIKTTKNIDVF